MRKMIFASAALAAMLIGSAASAQSISGDPVQGNTGVQQSGVNAIGVISGRTLTAGAEAGANSLLFDASKATSSSRNINVRGAAQSSDGAQIAVTNIGLSAAGIDVDGSATAYANSASTVGQWQNDLDLSQSAAGVQSSQTNAFGVLAGRDFSSSTTTLGNDAQMSGGSAAQSAIRQVSTGTQLAQTNTVLVGAAGDVSSDSQAVASNFRMVGATAGARPGYIQNQSGFASSQTNVFGALAGRDGVFTSGTFGNNAYVATAGGVDTSGMMGATTQISTGLLSANTNVGFVGVGRDLTAGSTVVANSASFNGASVSAPNFTQVSTGVQSSLTNVGFSASTGNLTATSTVVANSGAFIARP